MEGRVSSVKRSELAEVTKDVDHRVYRNTYTTQTGQDDCEAEPHAGEGARSLSHRTLGGVRDPRRTAPDRDTGEDAVGTLTVGSWTSSHDADAALGKDSSPTQLPPAPTSHPSTSSPTPVFNDRDGDFSGSIEPPREYMLGTSPLSNTPNNHVTPFYHPGAGRVG
jgi:hypothetical protein